MVQHKIVLTVPVFNEERYILETLRSVAAQSLSDFKVLISDNASTDETERICREFVEHDSRFHYVRQRTNLGAAANFQFCLKTANCDYFMWCGAHDVLAPNFLERTASLLDADPTTAIAFARRIRIDEASSRLTDVDLRYLYNFSEHRLVRYAQSICWLKECTIVNGLIRRAHIADVVFHPVWAADHVILSHLLWFGQVRYDGETWYARRYFKKRTYTRVERVTGALQPGASALPREVPAYANVAQAYAEDMMSLRAAGFPQHSAIHGLITAIVRGRFEMSGKNRLLFRAANRLLKLAQT